MIRSMTGFGKGEAKFKRGKITAEIKTVNHKFFDATLKLPESLAVFEEKIKELLQKSIKRGKVNLNLICDYTGYESGKVRINKALAKDYYNELCGLKRVLAMKGDVMIREIVALPGIIDYEASPKSLSSLWPKIKKAIDKALGRLIVEREKEGKSIYAELAKRAERIGAMVAAINARSHLNIEEYRKRFADRIKDFTAGAVMDMGRLEMEVAIFAKNSDISEEVARLKNHLVNFKKTIAGDGDVGKKLDFIAQELHREINTVGSKASDFKISKNAIDIKSEIEKIREQAKNIE